MQREKVEIWRNEKIMISLLIINDKGKKTKSNQTKIGLER